MEIVFIETRSPQRSWHYSYNPQGLLASIDGPRTDVNDVIHYQYNNQGQRTAITNALGHTTTVAAFNRQGLPAELVDANGVSTYLNYNARGWLLEKRIGGAITTFEYNGRADYNGGGSGMDSRGLISRITQADGSSLGYQYDHSGREVHFAYSQGQLAAMNLREAPLAASQAIVSQASYQGFGALTGLRFANRLQLRHNFDTNGRMQTINLSTAANEAVFAKHYRYDATSNIITDQRNQQQRRLHYGVRNRLQAVKADNLQTEYRYNAKGQRVVKRVFTHNNWQSTHFHYDSQNRLIAETDSNGNSVREYLYFGGRPVAMVDNRRNKPELLFIHNDHLGTPRVMTNQMADVVWTVPGMPFGEWDTGQNGPGKR